MKGGTMLESVETHTIAHLPESALFQPGGIGDFSKGIEEQNGVSVTTITDNYIIDRLGNKYPPSQFVAFSWTDAPTPADRYGICNNPWHLHRNRIVFIEYDGFITEKGFVLCDECNEYNDELMKWSKRLWIFYNPTTY